MTTPGDIRAGCRGSPRTMAPMLVAGVPSSSRGRRRGTSRPVSERKPPLILRLVTWQRMSFSEPLVSKRDIRPFEGAEQLDLVGVEPSEQPVEGGKAGGGGEQPVKAGLKLPLSARSGIDGRYALVRR